MLYSSKDFNKINLKHLLGQQDSTKISLIIKLCNPNDNNSSEKTTCEIDDQEKINKYFLKGRVLNFYEVKNFINYKEVKDGKAVQRMLSYLFT